MRHLLRLALRSLRLRLARTLLTTGAVTLGVAVILATGITILSTEAAILRLFNDASGRADLIVLSANTSQSGFSQQVLRRISNVNDVVAAVPSIEVQTRPVDTGSGADTTIATAASPSAAVEVQPSSSDYFLYDKSRLVVWGIDPLLDPLAREYKLTAGRFLSEDEDSYEVILVEDYAQANNISLGEDVYFVTPEGSESLEVVGLMSKEGAGRMNSGDFGVMPLATAQYLFSRPAELDQVDVVVDPNAASGAGLDALRAALQDRLGTDYSVTYPASKSRRVIQMIETYSLGLSLFSSVTLFVGMFLIYNVLGMTVAERTREIGMLRAVGMLRSQVARQTLIEASIIGVMGSALGILAGLFLARGLIWLAGYMFQLAQGVESVEVPVASVITGMVVGILVTLLAAGIPAWQAGRVSPLEAIRVRGRPSRGWLMRRGWILSIVLIILAFAVLFVLPLSPTIRYSLGQPAVFLLLGAATLLIPTSMNAWQRLSRPLVRRVYGNEGALGVSNLERARLRSTLTAAALMICIAMMVGIRGLSDAFEHDIQEWVNSYIGGDLYVYATLPMRMDLQNRLESVDGVAGATPIRYVATQMLRPDGDLQDVTFTAIDPESHRRVTSLAFTDTSVSAEASLAQLAEGDYVLLSSVLADRYELKRGDIVRLETKRGPHEFVVAGVVVDFTEQGDALYGSWKDLRRYYGVDNATVFYVRVAPGQDVRATQERIDALYGARRHLTIQSNEVLKQGIMRENEVVFAMFDILAMIAVIVAAFGVVNTLMVNILERTRELGSLRSIGMTKGQVAKMILAEAAMLGGIGGTFGIILGLFLERIFLMGAAEISGLVVKFAIPLEGILVGLLLAMLVSQVAALWPVRHAVRLRIVDAIQYE